MRNIASITNAIEANKSEKILITSSISGQPVSPVGEGCTREIEAESQFLRFAGML